MIKKIIGLIAVVSLMNCSSNSDSIFENSNQNVLSGSYANILALGDYLYLLGSGEVHTFNLSEPSNPELLDSQSINDNIESLFYNGVNLFVGSQEGMYIYEIQADGIPKRLSVTSYQEIVDVEPCDPITANTEHAYVTLSTTISDVGGCARLEQVNELLVFDIANPDSPMLVGRNDLDEPKGLGLDGNILFVCLRNDGIKVFDISDPSNLEELYHFDGFGAFDLIPTNGLLMVIGDDELHQFDYSDIENMYKLSVYDIKG